MPDIYVWAKAETKRLGKINETEDLAGEGVQGYICSWSGFTKGEIPIVRKCRP